MSILTKINTEIERAVGIAKPYVKKAGKRGATLAGRGAVKGSRAMAKLVKTAVKSAVAEAKRKPAKRAASTKTVRIVVSNGGKSRSRSNRSR